MKNSLVSYLVFLLVMPGMLKAQDAAEVFWLRTDALFAKVEIRDKDKKIVFSGPDFVSQTKARWKQIPSLAGKEKNTDAVIEKMLGRRLKPYEHVAPFLRTLLNYASKNNEEGRVDAFLQSVNFLLDQAGTPRINEYFSIIDGILADSVLSSYKSVIWKASRPDFQIRNHPAPEFIFNSIDLRCINGNSVRTLAETSGRLEPFTRAWKGQNGKMDWVVAGKRNDSIRIELKRYQLYLQGTDFVADSARLFHLKLFPEGVEGRIEDNFRQGGRPGLPRFETYKKNLKIPGISERIEYQGGLLLERKEITGMGSPGLPATISLRAPNGKSVRLRAQRFFFKYPFISARDAFASIHYGNDSIYHPAISCVFEEKNQTLSLYQGNSVLAEMPFFSSFHRAELQANTLQWSISDSLMVFKKGTGLVRENDAMFISEDYFRGDDYAKVQGIDPVNPLKTLYDVSKTLRKQKFKLQEYAANRNQNPDQVRAQILRLAALGFLIYDFDTETITLKDKLFHWVDSNNGKKDYDNLFIFSEKADTNGLLNLRNLDLLIFNVKGVVLSDSQKVYITPYNQRLTLKENRNISYSGKAKAGYFDFYSVNRNLFVYKDFQLSLPEIDSIQFQAIDPTQSKQNKPSLVSIESQIEKAAGTLQIDHPSNKSGRKNLKLLYPVFKSLKPSYVFYDRKGRFKKKYNRSGFYYQLDPFTLSNLDYFIIDSLNLKGTFYSDQIFQPLRKPLSIRPDYSLGLDVYTPKSGENIFLREGKGKGRFTGRLDLSHRGFRGDGKLEYLTGISVTDTLNRADTTDFLFFPDQVLGQVLAFNLPEARKPVEYPQVSGRRIREDWRPYADLMVLKSQKYPFDMYKGIMRFEGNLILKPDGLDGQGDASFDRARLSSLAYSFGTNLMKADSAHFTLRTPDDKSIALQATNYDAEVDFDASKATFLAQKQARVDYPAFEFTSNHSRFDWNIKKRTLALSSPGFEADRDEMFRLPLPELINRYEVNALRGPYFLATRPALDSLHFMAFSASYDMNTNTLTALEVPFLHAADALFLLPDRSITLQPEFKPISVENGRMVTKNQDIIFSFENTNGKIFTGKKFKMSGTLHFNESKKADDLIYFNTIENSNTGNYTIGTAQIADTSAFQLNPWFDFYGEAHLDSRQAALRFNGYYRLTGETCAGKPYPPIQTDTGQQAGQIALPFAPLLFGGGGRNIVSGLWMSRQGGTFYGRFFGTPRDPRDEPVFASRGIIRYNETHNRYEAGPWAVVNHPGTQGNFLAFNTESCALEMKGRFHFKPLFAPEVKIQTTGTARYFLKNDSLSSQLLLALNFPFVDKAWKAMETDLLAYDNPRVNIENEKYRQQLIELVGGKNYDILITDLENPKSRAREVLDAKLVLSDINFTWDSVNQVFNSSGNLTLLYLDGVFVGRVMKGYVQLSKKANAREDQLRILLRPDDDYYYFFDFGRGNVLRVYSSSKEFTDLVVTGKDEFNNQMEKAHADKRWQPFRLAPVTRAEAITFRAEMEKVNLYK
ncbi:MAG: hypothetical protein ACP5O2_06415 [Bacteroidales bacterium]